MISDPRVRTRTIYVRSFIASTTQVEVVLTEEIVQCVQPLYPYAVPTTSRGMSNAR